MWAKEVLTDATVLQMWYHGVFRQPWLISDPSENLLLSLSWQPQCSMSLKNPVSTICSPEVGNSQGPEGDCWDLCVCPVTCRPCVYVCSCSGSTSVSLSFPILLVPLMAESYTEAHTVEDSGQSSPGLPLVWRDSIRWGRHWCKMDHRQSSPLLDFVFRQIIQI